MTAMNGDFRGKLVAQNDSYQRQRLKKKPNQIVVKKPLMYFFVEYEIGKQENDEYIIEYYKVEHWFYINIHHDERLKRSSQK